MSDIRKSTIHNTHNTDIVGVFSDLLAFQHILSIILDIMFAISYINDMAILKNHIKQHRARLNLTQEDLGSRVGVRRQTILAIEKGQYVPSALLAFKIAKQLGMRVDELFELVHHEEV